jgi:hypothetical protein
MLSKVALKPGIVKDDTPLASEGGYVDSDRVRFWRGQPQALGGWRLKLTNGTFGIARGAHEWVDLSNNPLMAWGTATSLFALVGGAVLDITPPMSAGVLLNPFSTTNGSTTVVVSHPAHGMISGDSVTFTNATPTGGLTLNATFVVTAIDANSYSIVSPTPATSTITSGATASVDYVVPLRAGNVSATVSGYSAGPYSSGPYGGRLDADAGVRIWSLDNFGENLLAVPSRQGLYEWQPAFQSAEIVTNGGFSTDTAWTKGAGWTISGGTANKSAGAASLISQVAASGLSPGRVYRVTFNLAATAGTIKLQALTGGGGVDVGGASTAITRSGSYSRTFRVPVGAIGYAFSADAAFAGTLDAVSIKLESAAYRVAEAPANIGYMFVDPNRFVVTLATQEFSGTYNALLARWSDQENVQVWAPDTTNLSGELPLSSGGRILSGIASRQQNLIWTDTSLFGLTFTGDASVFSQRLLGTGCGLIGPNAAVEQDGVAFWWSNNGFYAFQGAAPQRLDCPLERDVFDNLVTMQAYKIYAGINPRFSEVWWMYPDARDGVECSRVVVFNYKEQTWVTHTMDRTCWLSGEVFDAPIGFSASGLVYDHEVGHDANGAPLNWFLTSAAFDIEDGENLVIIKGIVPDIEEQVGAITYELTPKLYPNAPALPTSSHTAETSTQALRMRRKGRQATMTMRSMSTPAFFRLGALRLDIEKSGAKR